MLYNILYNYNYIILIYFYSKTVCHCVRLLLCYGLLKVRKKDGFVSLPCLPIVHNSTDSNFCNIYHIPRIRFKFHVVVQHASAKSEPELSISNGPKQEPLNGDSNITE